MENIEENKPTEEISNLEQFQVGRAPEEEKNIQEDGTETENNEAGYAPEETEFADGQGTLLDDELSEDDDSDEEFEEEEDTEDNFQDQDLGKEEGIKPQVNDI